MSILYQGESITLSEARQEQKVSHSIDSLKCTKNSKMCENHRIAVKTVGIVYRRAFTSSSFGVKNIS